MPPVRERWTIIRHLQKLRDDLVSIEAGEGGPCRSLSHMTTVVHYGPDLSLVKVDDITCQVLTRAIQGSDDFTYVFNHSLYIRDPLEFRSEFKTQETLKAIVCVREHPPIMTNDLMLNILWKLGGFWYRSDNRKFEATVVWFHQRMLWRLWTAHSANKKAYKIFILKQLFYENKFHTFASCYWSR